MLYKLININKIYQINKNQNFFALKDINFEDLFNNNQWDIDHIYPQSLVKDDSFSNKVLTAKITSPCLATVEVKKVETPTKQSVRKNISLFILKNL